MKGIESDQKSLGDAIELLQSMIRNACVSRVDDFATMTTSGSELESATAVLSVLEGGGLDIQLLELQDGRPAVVARIEGSDRSAPSLAYVGHLDVVPATEEGWRHDPFGGALIDNEVWGRGALDMLGQVSTMAIAVRNLADSDFRPRGDLVYVAVPDEECGGLSGAKMLLERYPEVAATDFAITEVGGAVHKRPSGELVIEAYAAEKGLAVVDIVVRGVPGHSAFPYGSDNALVRLAAVVQLIEEFRPDTLISETWRSWVRSQHFDRATTSLLTDSKRLWDGLPLLPAELATQAHACTHAAIVPTIASGGEKVNSIPGSARLLLTVRTPPGALLNSVIDDLRSLLSGLVAPEDVVVRYSVDASASSIDTALWDVLAGVSRRAHSGSRLIPSVLCAQTDARWLRAVGTTTYGFALLSEATSPAEYWSRFHGVDERIDVRSLDLSIVGWTMIARQFLAS